MNDPFWRLSIVPNFNVTSADVADGQELPVAQISGIFRGSRWPGCLAEPRLVGSSTRDPELHRDHVRPRCAEWFRVLALALVDIPSSVTELPTGAGAASGDRLPEHAFHLPNDARLTQFIGGGPPPGDPRHR
jgi:phosphatidylethanolamine-binding protein (PEBP) family uncharacterized protein